MMQDKIKEIVAKIKIDGTFKQAVPFGDGLVNTTYKVETQESDKPNYLLQIINHHIFKNIPELTKNIKRVTTHIRKHLQDEQVSDINRKVLTPIDSNDKKGFVLDDEGNYWRAFLLIENVHTYNHLSTVHQAYQGGKAFGHFQKMLSNLPGGPIYPIVPDFHNTEIRISNLQKRIKENPLNRLKEVKKEVKYLLERSDEYKKILQLGGSGIIPERIIHQDTKFNNLLLDENDNVLCVIDLDLVSPGYVCYDIGDAIRNGANTGLEDDRNIDKVGLNLELFKGLIEGFLEETKDFLTPAEIDTLAFGAKLITYEQAVRFLDDYLDGDKYYKINTPDHNLVRVRAQIKLLQSMELHFNEMEEIVKEYLRQEKTLIKKK